MTLKDLAKTSLSNLGRHKVRTALSAVGVTVGILTIVTMVSLGAGVQRKIVRSFQSIGLETIEVRPVTEERTVFNQFAEPKRTVIITPQLVEELRGPVLWFGFSHRPSCPFSLACLVVSKGGAIHASGPAAAKIVLKQYLPFCQARSPQSDLLHLHNRCSVRL